MLIPIMSLNFLERIQKKIKAMKIAGKCQQNSNNTNRNTN